MREPTILRFVSILYRYSQMRIAKRMKPFGIGPGQYPFILGIRRQPGISQDGLAERLAIDKGTTAKAVKTLERGGFIDRRLDPADKRAYKLYPTKKGEELSAALDAVLLEWREILFSGFSEEERKQAYSLVVRMSENARECMLGS
jgi:DNA-binding MarR family transcriptional regulator